LRGISLDASALAWAASQAFAGHLLGAAITLAMEAASQLAERLC
jgi:hypothetical protein